LLSKEIVSRDCGISEVMKIFKNVFLVHNMSMIWQRMEF
jgi:hypothetical protein